MKYMEISMGTVRRVPVAVPFAVSEWGLVKIPVSGVIQ